MLFEYIWIDADNNTRSKTKVVHSDNCAYVVEDWNFDGSSTEQAEGKTSDIVLKPVEIFRDPFRRNNKHSYLVMCETYLPDGQPHSTNFRHKTKKLEESTKLFEPLFGIEQEYIINCDTSASLLRYDKQQDYIKYHPHYCNTGGNNVFYRDFANRHLEACLYAGIKICGINAEVTPYQWEFQIGTLGAVSVGDHLWVARYILNRLTEDITCNSNRVSINYHPKPYEHWNGSGCHTNFSTKQMRENKEEIYKACELLKDKHKEHLEEYGDIRENKLRLTGIHETASFDKFTYGVSDRGASIRIPLGAVTGIGYLEDRRPASNMDPYRVTAKILETVCCDKAQQ